MQLNDRQTNGVKIIQIIFCRLMYKYGTAIVEIIRGIGKPKSTIRKIQSGGLFVQPITITDIMRKARE